MSENNAKKKMSFGEIWQKFGTIGIFVLLLIILAVIKPDSVFNSSSVPQILKQSSVNVLLALGEFFAILIAGIDLSVGSVAALTGLLTAKMMIVGVPVPARFWQVFCWVQPLVLSTVCLSTVQVCIRLSLHWVHSRFSVVLPSYYQIPVPYTVFRYPLQP